MAGSRIRCDTAQVVAGFVIVGVCLVCALAYISGAGNAATAGSAALAATERRIESTRARLEECTAFGRTLARGEATQESTVQMLIDNNRRLTSENEELETRLKELNVQGAACAEENAREREEGTGTREHNATAKRDRLRYTLLNLQAEVENANASLNLLEERATLLVRALRRDNVALRTQMRIAQLKGNGRSPNSSPPEFSMPPKRPTPTPESIAPDTPVPDTRTPATAALGASPNATAVPAA